MPASSIASWVSSRRSRNTSASRSVERRMYSWRAGSSPVFFAVIAPRLRQRGAYPWGRTIGAMAASTTYDAIIIGGGHNGLVTACYLARAKWRVLVLERRYICLLYTSDAADDLLCV